MGVSSEHTQPEEGDPGQGGVSVCMCTKVSVASPLGVLCISPSRHSCGSSVCMVSTATDASSLCPLLGCSSCPALSLGLPRTQVYICGQSLWGGRWQLVGWQSGVLGLITWDCILGLLACLTPSSGQPLDACLSEVPALQPALGCFHLRNSGGVFILGCCWAWFCLAHL